MKKLLSLARHWFWIAPIVIGLAFVASGIYMISEGREAHSDVQDSIVQEDITVSEDAPAFGGETVDSADKADAQAAAILEHTLAATGGYLYADIGRYLLPEGNYMLLKGTYMTADGSTTQDVTLAAKDDEGNAIITTTDENLAAKNANDQPVRAWTSSSELAATDANGKPVDNPVRNTAKDSAFLRTSLGVAVMGFKISDLVTGLGAFMIVMGVTLVLFLTPAVYWAAVVANERETERGPQAEPATGRAAPQV
jgi:hypothetical protein